MRESNFTQKVYSYLRGLQRWYLDTPERSLDEAYKAALLIKAIEDEHFNGNKIAPESANYGGSVMAYFQSELKKHLKTARTRLTEFKLSRSWFSSDNQNITKLARNDGTTTIKDSFAIQVKNNSSLILEKLRFIDEVTGKYTDDEERPVVRPDQIVRVERTNSTAVQQQPTINNNADDNNRGETKASGTGVLPRSILNTLNRIQVELDPKAEEKVVKDFRKSQRRTFIAVRMILLFIIVPFLTHQLAKALVVGPLVDHFFQPQEVMFLNEEMEEKALMELQKFEERLKFENLLIGKAVAASPEQTENRMKEKVEEIAQEFRAESSNAIKNIFSDLLALVAFSLLIVFSKREIGILKDFIDQVMYGLSDSAKAFIIILFTDVFVGFHSPHGWEVLLGNASRHFGLPENHDFIFLFIATFPVILDTIFKYWIFRYLSRISPSAVATYRNMNE